MALARLLAGAIALVTLAAATTFAIGQREKDWAGMYYDGFGRVLGTTPDGLRAYIYSDHLWPGWRPAVVDHVVAAALAVGGTWLIVTGLRSRAAARKQLAGLTRAARRPAMTVLAVALLATHSHYTLARSSFFRVGEAARRDAPHPAITYAAQFGNYVLIASAALCVFALCKRRGAPDD